MKVNEAVKVLNYKHPGRPKGSKKEKYEDTEKFFECPGCGGIIDDYAYRCNKCGFDTVVLKEGWKVDKAATDANRSKLKRVNPWTGEKV